MSHPRFTRCSLIPAGLFALTLITGCIQNPVSSTDSSPTSTTAAHLNQVSFSGSSTQASVTLTGLSSQSVYLVKVNNSASIVSANQTGYALGASYRDAGSAEASVVNPSTSLVSGQFGPISRYDFAGARAFNANPPKISRSAARDTTAAVSSSTSTAGGTVNSTTHNFYVVKNESASTYTWVTVTATLRAISDSANVWVADSAVLTDTSTPLTTTSGLTDSYDDSSGSDNDGKITSTQARVIANTFAKIYPVETNVIGREFGGSDGTGGRDGDSRVNILVYDIGYDGAAPLSSGGIVGYFWAKDYYTQNQLTAAGSPYSSYKSNNAEIFYIDSFFADAKPGIMYSTLCHEFQHMVNFNNKFVKTGVSSDTWYDEMLSMTVEDMMSSYLETWLGSEYSALSDGPILNRMVYFDNGFYASGVTDWLSGDNVYYSYASAYAFGAYLARNYGGAPLVAAMESNSFVDKASISAALASVGASESTFPAAFQRYGEALVFSSSAYSDKTVPASLNTYDRASTTTVGSYSYTFPAFDIWNLSDTNNGTTTIYSPYYYGITDCIDLQPYGMSLHSTSAWRNVTGSLTVTLSKPGDSGVSLYLMVR